MNIKLSFNHKGAKVAALAALLTPVLSCLPQDSIQEVDRPPSKMVGRNVATPIPPPSPDQPMVDQVEVIYAPATAEALASEEAMRERLLPLMAGIADGRVPFIDCGAGGACTARVETRTLVGLRTLLQSASGRMEGGISFVARRLFDPYRGQFFQADLTLGGGGMTVPTNENELLVNFGDPPDLTDDL